MRHLLIEVFLSLPYMTDLVFGIFQQISLFSKKHIIHYIRIDHFLNVSRAIVEDIFLASCELSEIFCLVKTS